MFFFTLQIGIAQRQLAFDVFVQKIDSTYKTMDLLLLYGRVNSDSCLVLINYNDINIRLFEMSCYQFVLDPIFDNGSIDFKGDTIWKHYMDPPLFNQSNYVIECTYCNEPNVFELSKNPNLLSFHGVALLFRPSGPKSWIPCNEK